jgi:hypothetical protein
MTYSDLREILGQDAASSIEDAVILAHHGAEAGVPAQRVALRGLIVALLGSVVWNQAGNRHEAEELAADCSSILRNTLRVLAERNPHLCDVAAAEMAAFSRLTAARDFKSRGAAAQDTPSVDRSEVMAATIRATGTIRAQTADVRASIDSSRLAIAQSMTLLQSTRIR